MPEASMIRFRFREPCTSEMLHGPWKETDALTQLMFIEPPGMVVQVPTGEMTARPNSILVIISVPVERTLEGHVSISRDGRFCPAESRMSVETAGESFIEVAPMRDWVAGVAYGNRVLVWRLEKAWMDVGCTFNVTISSGVLRTLSYAEPVTTSVVRKSNPEWTWAFTFLDEVPKNLRLQLRDVSLVFTPTSTNTILGWTSYLEVQWHLPTEFSCQLTDPNGVLAPLSTGPLMQQDANVIRHILHGIMPSATYTLVCNGHKLNKPHVLVVPHPAVEHTASHDQEDGFDPVQISLFIPCALSSTTLAPEFSEYVWVRGHTGAQAASMGVYQRLQGRQVWRKNVSNPTNGPGDAHFLFWAEGEGAYMVVLDSVSSKTFAEKTPRLRCFVDAAKRPSWSFWARNAWQLDLNITSVQVHLKEDKQWVKTDIQLASFSAVLQTAIFSDTCGGGHPKSLFLVRVSPPRLTSPFAEMNWTSTVNGELLIEYAAPSADVVHTVHRSIDFVVCSNAALVDPFMYSCRNFMVSITAQNFGIRLLQLQLHLSVGRRLSAQSHHTVPFSTPATLSLASDSPLDWNSVSIFLGGKSDGFMQEVSRSGHILTFNLVGTGTNLPL
ncbi:MAG: hypothetical protein NZ577_04360 [Vicinamibacterales bacterium]|nr:hypothetical protein [Vicinamibacterales bacterium]